MRKATEYSRRLKRLMTKLKKEGRPAPLPPVEDPMDQLLRGILSDYAPEQKANGALARLRAAVVDLNELRVTPIADMVQAIGAEYPHARKAAEDILRALIRLFNKQHHLDLMHLKKALKRDVESFLEGIDLNPHAKATILLRCVKGHAVPADQTMCEFLRRSQIVPPDASADQIQPFLSTRIQASRAAVFYVQLKRYARSHMPKPLPPPATSANEAAEPSAADTAATGTPTRAARPAARTSRSSTVRRSAPTHKKHKKKESPTAGARRRHK